MAYDNEQQQQSPDQTQPSPPENAGQSFSNNDVEKIVRTRLEKEREKRTSIEKEKEELKKRVEELQKKVDSGKANQSESMEYQQTLTAEGKAQDQVSSGMIAPEQLPGIITQYINETKASDKIQEAVKEDPEFAELCEKNKNAQNYNDKITTDEIGFLVEIGIQNVPAVLKHLLKNDIDRKILKLAQGNINRDNGMSLTEFVKKLSNDIDSTTKRPSPSPYYPAKNVSDIGRGDDFDVSSYISDKY